MSEACESHCTSSIRFPKRPDNRPALPRIDYRIGHYGEIRQFLLRELNLNPTLGGWTHREADDPGIALLEGASIVGDILTFYQEHYANECYLRTSAWRESVSSLVALLGYRLSPAVGGKATFAFELKDGTTAVIPAAFPVKADLDQLDSPAEFETTEELTAYSYLSRFHLYRPRIGGLTLTPGSTEFEIYATGPSLSSAAYHLEALEALDLQPGAQIALVKESSARRPEIVKVKEVEPLLNRLIVRLDGALNNSWSGNYRAYVIGRSFRHFGHSSPKRFLVPKKNYFGKITGTKELDTNFKRYLNKNGLVDPSHNFYYPSLTDSTWLLDQEVKDLSLGGTVICTGRRRRQNRSFSRPFNSVRSIKGISQNSFPWGNLNGPATEVKLDDVIFDKNNSHDYFGDVRRLEFHEALSDALWIRPVRSGAQGEFGPAPTLYFFGTQAEAKSLAGRRLLFSDETGRSAEAKCENAPDDFEASGHKDAEHSWRWQLALSHAPEGFVLDDFDESEATATIFGNIADATQGRTQGQAVLGSGDRRQSWQTFPLPSSPLTYHLSPGATPAEVPELDVYVDGKRWERVDAFYGNESDSEVYIVRQDDEGKSYLQFGDGNTGSRLPSGKNNVTAIFRKGAEAYGPIKEGAKAQAIDKITGLSAVRMPGEATGGAPAEAGGNARQAAPGKIQSLGRLVSLQDYESEALQIPGVTLARASWGYPPGTSTADLFASPAVRLTLLMDSGRESEFDEVTETLQNYERCRGPSRQTILTAKGHRRYVALSIQYGLDPDYLQDDVEAAIVSVMGTSTDEAEAESGLFALPKRTFGDPEYRTRVEGCVQEVAGVTWSRLVGWRKLASADAPIPVIFFKWDRLWCSQSQVLQLHFNHLVLQAAPPGAASC